MTRRTVELLTALALGSLGTMVLRPTTTAPTPVLSAPVCEPPEGAATSPVHEDTAQVEGPAPSGARPRVDPDVWDGVAALGYVPMGKIHRLELPPGGSAEVELMLTPSPRACDELVEGRCTAGCFEVMAAAGFSGRLHLEVTPLDDPQDVIATELRPGSTIAAGHCRGYALGHAGYGRVRARVSALEGHGPVELSGWRHEDPKSTPSVTGPLHLPRLGTSREHILALEPRCAEDWYETEDVCRFHGSVGLPLSETCEDGCTWWAYRFDEGRLVEAELRRSVVDVNAQFVGRFVDEAGWIASALEGSLGAPALPESLATWDEVEADDEPRELQRRTWSRPEATTTWSLVGIPGHHPIIELHVTVTRPGHRPTSRL
ncbi:MAG: hypothetical protein AAGF11_10840 [Myxococcota bacterium]